MGELKNLCVKIPLLKAIKDVLIYNKLIKEKCFKHPGRRKRDTPTINIVGKLSDLMLGRVISPKYIELGTPIVDVHIDGLIASNTLIDLGAAMSVMTKETLLKLNIQWALRNTTTVLQLAERSTLDLEQFVEDVMVYIES